MNAEEFVIKKFETNNPELVKSIEEWTDFLIYFSCIFNYSWNWFFYKFCFTKNYAI